MDDVAVVDVAKKLAKVGVEVAMITPDEFKARIRLAPAFWMVVFPETVREVRVPTDVREEAVTPEPRVVPFRTEVPLM